MKKIILLCGFGLLGTFALANEPVVSDSKIAEAPKAEATCSCELSPEGTCTITVYPEGFGGPSETHVFYNVTIQWCAWKRNQLLAAV